MKEAVEPPLALATKIQIPRDQISTEARFSHDVVNKLRKTGQIWSSSNIQDSSPIFLHMH